MTIDRGYFPSDDRPDDLPYESKFGNVSTFGPVPSGSAGGVPEDFAITYVNGQALTVADYASQFGTGTIYSGMPWDEFYRLKDQAKYRFDTLLFREGLTAQRPAAPYDAEQGRRDAANLADFDDSADLRRVGFVNPFVSGGGGGRRGGGGRAGAAAPVYESPNREALAQAVKTYVVAVTGTNRPDLVDQAVEAYLAEDRRGFDQDVAGQGGEQVDPMQAVYKTVRGSTVYKSIHSIRPESVDELDWVTSRQGKLRQAGLSAQRAEQLGIRQATSGANDAALMDAAEMANVADTGRLFQSQRDSLAASARSVMGLI